MEQIFISGQIGKAVFEQDDRYYVVGVGAVRDPVEYRPGDVSFLFDSGAEFSVISDSHLNVADIGSLLEFQTQAHRALSVTISGMDDDLSSESRLLSIEAAEEFLHDESLYVFVRSRMLARTLPSVADLTGALSNAESAGASLTGAIYKEVSKSQGAIAIVVKAWKETAQEFFDSIDEEDAAEKVLIETGVFAEMVAALTSGDAIV